METGNTQVPIKPGLFEFCGSGRAIRLIGSQCAACGEKFFPQKSICPACSARDMKTVPLSRTGIIRTYAVVRQATKTWKGPVPYVIVLVTLDDGVKLMTHLTNCDPDNVKIGARVEAVAEKLRENEDGLDIIAHMFKYVD